MMKQLKRGVFLLTSLIVIYSCGTPENQEYRRFCIGINLDSVSVELQSDLSDSEHMSQIKGIYKLTSFKNERSLFTIVDVNKDWDYQDLLNALVESSNFRCQALLSEQAILLERIFEMDQKEVCLPEEGQLKSIIRGDFNRYVSSMEIQPDPELIEEYRKVHAIGMAWPQIITNMKSMGITDMELYLMGTRAFLIMDAKPDFDMERDVVTWGNLPGEKEWQAYVSKFQKTDPGSSIKEKWIPMDQIK